MKKTSQLVNKLRENKGITLIALVITIIVLLILAGVAVSSITGNDDIMDKAQNAKVATDNANEEEEIKMAAVTAMADNMEGLGVLTAGKLSEALNSKYPVVDEGNKIKVFASSIYTLDKNGSVTNDGETPKGEFSITSFSYTPNTVNIGSTSSVPAVNISGTPYQGPKYTSSDTNKATVNETTGVVTGVASGEVTITVTYKNYQNIEVTETTTVTVKPAFTTQNFSYTGSVQTCTLPAGKYKLEVWGAQGGSGDGGSGSANVEGGKGGYSIGNINLLETTDIYVYVGGKGKTSNGHTSITGGFNGGGNGATNTSNSDSVSAYRGSGGGATDIRIKNDSLYARVVVAGGGGGTGGSGNENAGVYATNGGVGGGNSGGKANNDSSGNTRIGGYAGTQTSGGNAGAYDSKYGTAANGVFGQGGTSGAIESNWYMGGAGGGGWYGGRRRCTRWPWRRPEALDTFILHQQLQIIHQVAY